MFQPLRGDMLITKDYIVGIMVRFEKKAGIVSGEYYIHKYPIDDDIRKLKEKLDAST